MSRFAILVGALVLGLGCGARDDQKPTEEQAPIPSVPVGAIPGHGTLAEDNTHKEGPRLLPVDSALRVV